jgi:phosphatidate cytidylyltransferase
VPPAGQQAGPGEPNGPAAAAGHWGVSAQAAAASQAAPPPEAPVPSPTGETAPGKPQRGGRNLPVAIGVGLALGGLAILTLFTVKVTFLVYVAIAIGIALWELSRALRLREISLPLAPVAVGGAAALALAYWKGERALVACLALTVIAVFVWRLPRGTVGYLRDVTGGVFTLAYLPLMASFVSLMLAAPDGPRRALVFLIVTVCSDVGGYFAGTLMGRHLMAPVISPK